jgi:hypothetical protein
VEVDAAWFFRAGETAVATVSDRVRTKRPASALPNAADFRREFVSDVKAVSDGVATLKHLSRYVFRTAITNDRILSMKDSQVTF